MNDQSYRLLKNWSNDGFLTNIYANWENWYDIYMISMTNFWSFLFFPNLYENVMLGFYRNYYIIWFLSKGCSLIFLKFKDCYISVYDYNFHNYSLLAISIILFSPLIYYLIDNKKSFLNESFSQWIILSINVSAPRFLKIVPKGISTYLSRSKYYYVNEEKDQTWTDIMEAATTHMFFHEIARGFGIIVSQVFREPATINYPFEKGPLSPRFRGEHALRRYAYK